MAKPKLNKDENTAQKSYGKEWTMTKDEFIAECKEIIK